MSWPTRIVLVVALCLLALLCWQLVPGCDGVSAAPAPFHRDRDEMPQSMVGEWNMKWGEGVTYDVTFYSDGSYRAMPYNYKGVWHMRGRTLYVTEALTNCNYNRWYVRFDKKMCGTIVFVDNSAGIIRTRMRRIR